ncbi:MAG: hypothetical protein M0C28_44965 [Candidatus Moduliflexus flocculans]|nr:hypothetical protein [Candidatus Moduliflexus flocculans]
MKSPGDLAAYRFLFENTRYERDYDFAWKRRGARSARLASCCAICQRARSCSWSPSTPGSSPWPRSPPTRRTNWPRRWPSSAGPTTPRPASLLSSPAEVLMIPENLSSEVVGPKLLRALHARIPRNLVREIAAAGKHSCVHLDGTLKGLPRQVASAGFAFIEAMTPAPVGDLAVEEWAGWPDGGRAPGLLGRAAGGLFHGACLRRRVRPAHQGGPGGHALEPRYVLGVADQVPPDGLERRIRRVAELADECGRYG